jgi:hypothetical protein
MVEAERSAPSDPSWPSQRSRSTIMAVAESSVRDTALGGADTAGSRGGLSGDAGEAERSVGGGGSERGARISQKALRFGDIKRAAWR